MRDEFVRRRGWLDEADFIDVLGASSLIPGPTSSELAMHIGHRRGGWPGLVVAGLGFLLPAVVIVGVLAWIYVEQGTRVELSAILAAVAPVVVAVIVHAGAGIARATLRTPRALVLLGLAVAAVLLGVPEIAVLLGTGLLGLAIHEARSLRDGRPALGAVVSAAGPLERLATSGADLGSGTDIASGSAPTSADSLASGPGLASGGSVLTTAAAALGSSGALAVAPLTVLLEMARIGAVLFGSGYVIVALFRSEFVVRLGWINETQLLDAIAVGQATPGPLFSTATFVGYLAAGPLGAVAATVGIFVPAFVAVAISIPLLARLRASRRARAFLDGVNAATVGLLAVVAVQLAIGALVDPIAVGLALGALVLLTRGVGTALLITAAAGIGLIRLTLGG
jgi:chromate transporter